MLEEVYGEFVFFEWFRCRGCGRGGCGSGSWTGSGPFRGGRLFDHRRVTVRPGGLRFEALADLLEQVYGDAQMRLGKAGVEFAKNACLFFYGRGNQRPAAIGRLNQDGSFVGRVENDIDAAVGLQSIHDDLDVLAAGAEQPADLGDGQWPLVGEYLEDAALPDVQVSALGE